MSITFRPVRLLAWTVAVITTAVVAFLAYGAHTRAQPASYGRGGNAFAPSPGPVVGSSAASRSGAAAPSQAAALQAAPVTRPVPPPAAARRSAGRAPAPAAQHEASEPVAPPEPAARSAAVQLPALGSYALAVTGSERIRFGPFSACSRSFPRSTTLVLSRAAGEGPTSVNADLRVFPSSPGQHDERHIYRYTDRGVLLDYENATVTCAGVRQSTEISFEPAVLRVPEQPRVGQRWTGRGGDSERTESSTSQVLREESVQLAGRAVRTFLIETRVTISGSERGSRLQRWWWSPEHHLPLRWVEEIEASRSGATYASELTATVVRTP